MESRSGRRWHVARVVVAIGALVAGTARAEARGLDLDAFGAGAGGEPRVKVYLSTLFRVADFLAFPAGFRGGVRVAVGDIDGDGLFSFEGVLPSQ
jgi:hypothetical protein